MLYHDKWLQLLIEVDNSNNYIYSFRLLFQVDQKKIASFSLHIYEGCLRKS